MDRSHEYKDSSGNLSKIFLQPFSLLYEYNDYHVMLYVKDHPEYEAVEAMIRENGEGIPRIRVIVTRQNQTQIDYVNFKNPMERGQNPAIKRETYYSEIFYVRTREEDKPRIQIQFKTHKGETVSVDFYCARNPSKRHGGLTNPERHSETGSLPVMYRGASALASPKSKITICGVEYKIPVKIKIPFLFTAMKGFLSTDFAMGVMRSSDEKLKIRRIPEELTAGQSWIYENESGSRNYRILCSQDHYYTVFNGSEEIQMCHTAGGYQIQRIQLHANKNGSVPSTFSFEFSPALPLFPVKEPGNKEIRFGISIDRHSNLISGRLQAEEEEGGIRYRLYAENPDWAVKRGVVTTVKLHGDVLEVTNEIILGKF